MVAARFVIVPGVALRGASSTGFRAPSLAQQFFATTSTNNVAGTLIEVGTFPVSNPVSVALGSKPLKAEKSTNLGGGIALNPIRSEERRVGKEWVSKFISRWSPSH